AHSHAHSGTCRTAFVLGGRLYGLGGLELGQFVQVQFVDAAVFEYFLLELLGHGDVFDIEFDQGNAHRVKFRGHDLPTGVGEFRGVGRVQFNGQVGLAHRIGKSGGDQAFQVLVDLKIGEVAVGPHNVLDELPGIGYFEGIGPKGPDLHKAETVIAQGYGTFGAPFLIGKKVGVHKINLRLERGVEAVFPTLEGGQDGQVGSGQVIGRSEERRVGKERRWRGTAGAE